MSARLLPLLLGLLLFASALAVVWSHHEARQLFVALQEQEATRDALDEEWGRLRLEQGTWSTHHRIERIARERLGLVPPHQDVVTVLVDP